LKPGELPDTTNYIIAKNIRERKAEIVKEDLFETTTGRYNSDAAYFEHKTVIIPADLKRETGGEDSADSCDNMLVVADGVGGWSLQGIDPAIFSSKLTSSIVEDHTKNPNSDPKSHVRAGCAAAIDHSQGSATAVAVKVKNEFYLTISTLGDCGAVIFRPLKGDRLSFLYETFPAQHMFNAPFQCGTNVDNSNAIAIEGIEYMEGDIIVLFSDGFSDNVFRSGYY